MESLTFLVGIAQAAGVAGGPIFAVFWWLERTERRQLQKERDALLERVLAGMQTTSQGLASLVQGTTTQNATLSAIADSVKALLRGRRV